MKKKFLINSLVKSFIFISLLFIVLNPYTVLGNLGIYATIIPLIIFIALNKFKVPYFNKMGLLFLLSFWGVVSSFINGIPQFNHLMVVLSTLIVFFSGNALAQIAIKYDIDSVSLLNMLNTVIIVNCVIIIIEIFSPSFRVLIESFLVESGNRSWLEGFRYRGLASSGGASLSLLSPLSILLGLYLYFKGTYSLTKFLLYILVVICSTIVIGRTGLVLCGFTLAFVILFLVKEKGRKIFTLLIFSFFIATIALIMLYPFLENVLTEQYGEGFFNYSFGFILDGGDGLKNEGTLSVLFGFLSVFPSEFPQILSGYGFFGGSEFSPWTDSGVARTFLSIGLPLGLAFYFIIISVFISAFKNSDKPIIFHCSLLILLVGELKEPMLYSGYGSRVLFLTAAFLLVYKKFKRAMPNV